MDTISPALNHPKSIWTWNRTKHGKKATLYIPYLQKIEKERGGWRFYWSGGDAKFDLRTVECILLYGATSCLPCTFLDELRSHSIPLLIHRRNMAIPSVFMPGNGCDTNDILTQQILARENEKKRSYIVRQVLRNKFKSCEWVIAVPSKTYSELAACRNVDAARLIEARVSKRYYKALYDGWGAAELNRRDKHSITNAQDACSVFLTSIVLRWCLYHNLSLSHGYLHSQSSYPALVFDLIEPYRVWVDIAVGAALAKHGDEGLVDNSITELKDLLDSKVYVPTTRETATRAALLHGVVLALRAYLLGDMDRFVLPVEGKKEGGRPIKVSYSLPGGVK